MGSSMRELVVTLAMKLGSSKSRSAKYPARSAPSRWHPICGYRPGCSPPNLVGQLDVAAIGVEVTGLGMEILWLDRIAIDETQGVDRLAELRSSRNSTSQPSRLPPSRSETQGGVITLE